MVNQAVPQQPMQGYDLDYTNGGLQHEFLVAARLGKNGEEFTAVPKRAMGGDCNGYALKFL